MQHSLAIELERAGKVFGGGASIATALDDVSLAIAVGELVALVGPSGSGKSTLLNLIAGLDAPTRGRVTVLGTDVHELSEEARCELRLRRIGIVFQGYNLLPALTVVQNVALPLELQGMRSREARRAAIETLAEVGLWDALLRRYPAQLSGGEQQRAALARALVTQPRLLLADEPTGSLDQESARIVLDLVDRLNAENEVTVVLATHSAEVAARADRVLELAHGRLIPSVTRTRQIVVG